jgi:hypothetical protein
VHSAGLRQPPVQFFHVVHAYLRREKGTTTSNVKGSLGVVLKFGLRSGGCRSLQMLQSDPGKAVGLELRLEGFVRRRHKPTFCEDLPLPWLRSCGSVLNFNGKLHGSAHTKAGPSWPRHR